MKQFLVLQESTDGCLQRNYIDFNTSTVKYCEMASEMSILYYNADIKRTRLKIQDSSSTLISAIEYPVEHWVRVLCKLSFI